MVLVAYALDITQVDPIKYNLLFSRFMTKDAKDYPDIDYDVSSPMELKEMLIDGAATQLYLSLTSTNFSCVLSSRILQFTGSVCRSKLVTSKMLAEATPIAKKKHGIKAGIYTPTFER